LLQDCVDARRSVIGLVDRHAVVLLGVKNEQYQFKNSCGDSNPKIFRKPVARKGSYLSK